MKKRLLILFIFTIFSLTKSYGDHISGGNLSFLYLGNSKYEITLTTVLDCNGTPHVLSSKISYKCNNSTQNSITLPFLSKKEVTGFGTNCNAKSRCLSTSLTGYGLEEYKYRGILDLSALNCCEVEIYWAEGNRNNSINTIPLNNFMYLLATINKCAGASIVWDTIAPQTFLQVGKKQNLSFSASTNFNNDSISYTLVNPLGLNGVTINYNGRYSAQKPLNFLGFPNNNVLKPAGFHIDKLRGNVEFSPQFVNQATVICIEATAWRRINGVMQKIAKSRTDQMLSIISQNKSSTPYQKTVDVFKGCEGDTSSVIIEVENDPLKKYKLKFSHNLKWAKAAFVNGTNFKYITVRYLEDTLTPQHFSDAFTLDIRNNDCPLAGRTVKTYGLDTGGKKFIDSSLITKNNSCGTLVFDIGNKNLLPDIKYKWTIKKDSTVTYHDSDLYTQTYGDTGWVKATLNVYSPNYCNFYTYTDSVFIQKTDIIKLSVVADTNRVCFSTPVNTFISEVQAKSPLNYQWSTGQKGDTIQLTPKKGENYYTIKLTDSNGCVIKDSIKIINYHPTVSINSDSLVCYGDSVSLEAIIGDTLFPAFKWDNAAYSKLKIRKRVLANAQYTFTLNDGGCIITQSAQVKVSQPKIIFQHQNTVCQGQDIQLIASSTGGIIPYQIFWDTYQKAGSTILINTKNAKVGVSSFTATTADTFGCKASNSSSFEILPTPKVSLIKPSPICEENTSYSLFTLGTPQGGIWQGQGVSNSIFNATQANLGISELKYMYTNPEGCSDSDFIFIKVYAKPIINFTSDSISIFKGSKVSFTNSTIADTTYRSWWNFGDEGKAGNKLFKQDGSYTYNDTGKYTVELRVNNGVCSIDSIVKIDYVTVKRSTVSVFELNNKNTLKLYPNPAKDKLTIEAGTQIIEIVLVDILGKRYKIENLNTSTKAEINIEYLPAGIYVIEAKDVKGNIYTSKVQISR